MPAMSRQDLEFVRDVFEQFARGGDIDWELTAEDVVAYDHDIMDGREYHGHDGIRRWLGDWGAAWSSFTMEPEEYIDAGDCVVVIVRMRATGARSGIEVDRQDGLVYRLAHGRVARLDYYNSRRQALEAAGLPAA